MRVTGALRTAALLAAAFCPATLLAKKDDPPNFAVNEFSHFPYPLDYFEDSDVILSHDPNEQTVYRSEDAGFTWKKIDTVPDKKAYRLFLHRYDPTRAYILTDGIQHYRTSDRGKTWEAFHTDAQFSVFRDDLLQFHADDPNRIIFNGMDCQGILCDEVAMYTLDGFSTDAKFLRGNTAGCWWAKSSHLFTTTKTDLDNQRILCIVRSPISPFKHDQRLLISDTYFSATSESKGVIQEFEPDLDMDKPMQGVVNIAIVKKYLLVATMSLHTDELALFVTDDTLKWHRAVFPHDHRIHEGAYTVLESTNYSVQIDVMTTRPSNPMGVILTSNSNGTFFTRNIEHTNRNYRGNVDFEKISGIQGIFLVNKVKNWEKVETTIDMRKQVQTEITFDDGRTFEDTMAGNERIHLHSVTELNNVGRVYSSPAPGLVMGNGNTGEYLRSYWEDGNLYVSDDAGKTWVKGIDGPHKYEFGDSGSILVAIRDSKEYDIGEIRYSLNHGQEWRTAALPEGLKIRPLELTTTQDSTSLKFILVGEVMKGSDPVYKIIAIDFEGLHEATCKEENLEEWFARSKTCLMGHTQSFTRRKKDADCFVKHEFKEFTVKTTDCDCTALDYECDFNFGKENGECFPNGPLIPPAGACTTDDPEAEFTGSSGWRKIPGNTCISAKDEPKEAPKKWKCSAAKAPANRPATDKLSHTNTKFTGDWYGLEVHYMETGASSSTDDETIIMRTKSRTDRGDITITHDHGKTWKVIEEVKGKHIWAIEPHHYFKEVIFFVSTDGHVWYSIDRGHHIHSFPAPFKPDTQNRKVPLLFHPDKKDWFLWAGSKCDDNDKSHCYPVVSFSKDRGDNWETGLRYAERCEFIGSHAYKYADRKEEEILCLARQREDDEPDNPRQLIATTNWFDDQEVRLANVKDFATMAEFIVVATQNTSRDTLAALASIDGKEFAQAHFPVNFKVSHQHAYTVLDSSTHAVNLFVQTETKIDRKYGAILKSNSNGTSYVMSINDVNCDNDYYVDFDKIPGLEGVAMVNIVANIGEEGAPKKLQTKITHNDGAEWAYLDPPEKDVDGNKFACSKGSKDCALHIHGFTERLGHQKAISSDGAVGIMFGWGNVGAVLGSLEEADTYMTNDAGITWRQVMKGRYTWAFGDQGSIIVLAKLHEKINTVYYSVDGGLKWSEPYQFWDDGKVEIADVTSFRAGSSRNFMVTGTYSGGVFTSNLDFSGFSERVCKFDEKDASNSDYELFTPRHPMQKNGCLFGHQTSYLRKKPNRKCYNDVRLETLFSEKNCTCTRSDFECAYNYEVDNHGACHLVEGLQPLSMQEWCAAHPGVAEYYEPSGYRRIPLTTCVGGVEHDKVGEPVPCDKMEDEFNRIHSGPSAIGIFFAVVVPFAAAAAIGWWVWRNWSSKFGQIRLGEHPGGGSLGGAFDEDRPWVRYPIIAISAAVALVGALPLVVSGAWKTAKGAAERWGFGDGRGAWSRVGGTRRFTTRDSFARGRGDYAVVDEDEGELLGDESDEEV